ncbi:MAG: glycosyltransferase [Chitinophagales bacterium]
MKKVLIITYYWPPAGGGGVQRWVKFVKYLHEFGWEPVVYTVAEGEYPVLDPSLEREIPREVEVIRRPILEPFSLYKKLTGKKKEQRVQVGVMADAKKGNWKDRLALWIRSNIFIPDARMLWIRPSVRFLKKYLKNNPVDVVITTGPPHSAHLIGMQLKEQLQLPWVADFRDPWTKIYYFSDLWLTDWARRKHHHLERQVLRNADKVIVVGEGMARDFKNDVQVESTVITNGFDTSDFGMAKKERNKVFTIVHTGTLLNVINPVAFWKALEESYEKGMIGNFEVHLFGRVEAGVSECIAGLSIAPFVKNMGYVSHEVITQQQVNADLLLLSLEPNTPVLSGKFFEYLGSQSPILAIGNSKANFEVKTIVEQAGAGRFFENYEQEAIRHFIEQHYVNYTAGTAGKTVSDDLLRYSRKSLTADLATVLHNITNGNHK